MTSYQNVLLHPDDRARWTATWKAHLRGDGPYDLEVRLLTKDRGYRWFWHRGQAAWDDAGHPLRMAGSISDVTERHEAVAALKESDARFQMMAGSIQEAFWLAEARPFRLLYVSPGFERIWGMSGDDFLADYHALLDRVHPDDRPIVIDAFSGLHEPAVRSAEFRITKTDGTECWLLVRTFPVPRAHGPALVSGIASDITARKNVERALRQSEERYRAMLQAYPEGAVFLFDKDLRFIVADGQGLAAAGRTSADYLGHHVSEVVDRKISTDLEPLLRDVLGGEERTYTAERSDGRVYDCRIVPLRDINGAVIAGMLISRDISERRRHERANATLEAQLRQAQKMEAIGQLAGGVAHDFNNLLTVIGAHTHFLLNAIGGGAGAEDARAIEDAANRAADVTRQLLAFSRKQIMRPTVLNLNLVVENAHKLLGRTLGEDITMDMVLAPDLGDVVADAGQISQVLINLAVNARDAMPNGGVLTLTTANVTITSDVRAGDALIVHGDYVVMEVRDTGVGMDAPTQARVFEPFFTTKEVGKGTGLGLATAYGIVKQSNGYITLDSRVGGGTTFRIYLPRASADEEHELVRSAEHRTARGMETVLVVEDEPLVREIALRTLRRYGYNVLEATDGVEALSVAAQYAARIDLVLADVVMPRMGGAELVRELQRRRPDVRALFMSGYTDDEVVRRGVASNSATLLQKPFIPDRLARAVREALDHDAPRLDTERPTR